MKEFTWMIKDELGVHARPAGLLVKELKKYVSNVTLSAGGKSADARRLMAIMTMGIKCGDTVVFKMEGSDEDAAATGLLAFCEENW